MTLDALFGEEPKVKPVVNDEFKILSDKQHVIMRPGMYIGSTSLEKHETWLGGNFSEVEYVAGLAKCANELIDNSVDEAIRTKFEYANKISVKIERNTFIVQDNGRGIPQDKVQCPDGRVVLRPEAAWTMTKAGSNFTDSRETIGMNGVGSALANFFSSVFIGETCDGKNKVTVSCSDGADTVNTTTRKSKDRGTKVTFIPDFSHFDCSCVDENTVSVLRDRLQALAVAYPEIEFSFNGKKLDNKFKKYASLYAENHVLVEQNGMSFMFATTDQGFRHNSFVNGVQTKVGGVHVNTVFEKIADEIIPMVKRKYKLDINRARVKECSTIVLFLRGFNNPKYDSQTKERLTNTAGEVNNHIGELDYTKLARKIVNDEKLIMPIIESALARKLAAEKAAETKAAKAAKKANVAKHVKANSLGDKTKKTTLFLTEGDSAIGYFLKVRDQDTQGGFPLRGKVLNSWDLNPAEVLKNKELFEIMSILNLTIGGDVSEMTYDNIAIMTDADVDGVGSIYPTLLGFFYKHWPILLEEGRVMFINTPIKIVTDSTGKDHWFYSEEEFAKWKGKIKELRYIKGLGSLTEDEYERVVRDPVVDIVEIDSESTELFEMLLGDSSEKRKSWMYSV